jgi:hypothetical protein
MPRRDALGDGEAARGATAGPVFEQHAVIVQDAASVHVLLNELRSVLDILGLPRRAGFLVELTAVAAAIRVLHARAQ